MERKRVTGVFAILVFLVSFGLAGTVGAYWYDLGPDSSLDLSGTDPNLQLVARINPYLDTIKFNLDVGQSTSFWFATFGTTETQINQDDKRVSNIDAYVDFFGNFKAKIPGQSFGFSTAYQQNVDELRPLLQSVRGFLSSYPKGGMSPQQIIDSLDWSLVPADQRGQYQTGLSSVLGGVAVNGIIPKQSVDRFLASFPDPNAIGAEGFSQGYFVTWNDQIPTLPDGTPDYGQSGWIKIDDTPVDVYFGKTGHLQLEFDDVFASGLFWLDPNYWNLNVMLKITHLSDPVPEPGTLLFVVTGLAGVIGAGFAGRRKRNRIAHT